MTARELLFLAFAVITVASALLAVTRRHPMSSALYLIVTLFAVAGLFVLRDAHFLAVVQVMIYAGAVAVVLFPFVIMLINIPADRLPADRKVTGLRLVGATLSGLLLLQVAVFAKKAGLSPIPGGGDEGTIESVGRSLFSEHLLAFELTSVLLLAAAVGALVLARRKGF